MRRCLCCLLLLLGLVSPTALALDEESAAQATQAQSEAFGFDDLERIGEAYTGQADIAGARQKTKNIIAHCLHLAVF